MAVTSQVGQEWEETGRQFKVGLLACSRASLSLGLGSFTFTIKYHPQVTL